METNIIKKDKKKGLSFTSITSDDIKKNLINLLNTVIDRCNISGNTSFVLPINPTPNISFWVSDEEKRCGFTITRENAKYGWRLSDDKMWVPCSYMIGMGVEDVVFSKEENEIITDLLYDHCKKYKYVESLKK